MGKKLTTEEFIEKAKLVHGDKYDYSLVEYINSQAKIKIICKTHGSFLQIPSSHLSKKGCSKCAGKYRPTTEEFIEKAKLIHGEKYDYSKVEYKTSDSKIKIICKTHGSFSQKANNHLNGAGCSKCADRYHPSTEEFIKKAKLIHGDKYDYSFVEYNSNKERIKIICKTHGSFLQKANNHLSGAGCPNCAGVKKSNTEEFIEKAKLVHGDKYDYSLVNYINATVKVKIICKAHEVFIQTPKEHINNGQGCPICKESKGEKEIAKILTEMNIEFEREYRLEDCRNINPLPFDFYIKSINSLIEFQGRQHYEFCTRFHKTIEIFYEQQKRDKIKVDYCAANNIPLIIIPYTEIDNIKNILQPIIQRYALTSTP